MKKTFLAILLAAIMCFAFVGCGGTNNNGNGGGTNKPDTGSQGGGTSEETGYKVTFACDDNVSVLVYKTQDMSGTGEKTTTAFSRDSETGDALKDGNGQVNFKLVFKDGYELKDIDVDGEYNNLKGSADTGVENGYRITKIASDLTVTVASQAENTAEDLSQGYKITFVCDEHVSVVVYRTQDMSADGEQTNTAYSREGGTGTLTKSGDGQVNFMLVFDDGYELKNITATVGNYNNIKYPNETEVENGYRITKITGDLTVTVTSQEEGAAEDLSQGYKITFVCDSHVSVTVYRTQDMSADGETTNTAYSRDGDNGALLKDGNGQVNFVLVFDDGYELDDIVITGTYKNKKELGDNGYRITKIESELTITISSKQS